MMGDQIQFCGFHSIVGSTDVSLFWGDIHDLSFRGDKVIQNVQDLKDQAERFNADRTQFDWTSYASYAKFNKASREYFSLVEGRQDLYELVYELEGKTYEYKTQRWGDADAVFKKADKIISYMDVQTIAIYKDTNREIVRVVKELGRTNHFDSLAF